MNSLRIEQIVCSCGPGAELFECMREAVILCLTEKREVHFTHNGRLFIAEPKLVVRKVFEDQHG